jgi:hypothetical protein
VGRRDVDRLQPGVECAGAGGFRRRRGPDARQIDLTIWSQWVVATAAGDTALAGYIEDRFTPAFRAAYDAWISGGSEEPSPLAREEYVPAGTERAVELTERADAKFEQALLDNRRGDNYSLLTVLFALVLFLTAMAQRQALSWARTTFLVVALVAATVALVVMLTFPIRI